VVRIDPGRRQVIVGPREAVLKTTLQLTETNWLGDDATIEDAARRAAPVLARVRSTRPPAAARLALDDGAVVVAFEAPEEAVAPGQACVLYDAAEPSRVFGGGFIARD
jgi:tRNA-specific 2-thiouridylase